MRNFQKVTAKDMRTALIRPFKVLSFKLSFPGRHGEGHTPLHVSLPFLRLSLPFSPSLPPSYLPLLPLSPSLSARLRSARSGLRTPFHHLNFASPLKDWPHTKLLFKGKKTHAGGWRGVAGARVHTRTHARREHEDLPPRTAIQEMIHPTPGLADNFSVSWSQSLCASHFLWGSILCYCQCSALVRTDRKKN